MKYRFKGVVTALVTPFKHDLSIDISSLQELLLWQISSGIDGMLICGSTGEGGSLSLDERRSIIEATMIICKNRIPIMVGVAGSDIVHVISCVQQASELGADAVLISAPLYAKPTQDGIYQYYKAIHDKTDIPIYLYNVPSRVGVDIADDIIARLSNLPRVIGLKCATGDLTRPITLATHKLCKEKFDLLSGEDMTSVAFASHGGVGTISVTSNIAPKQCKEIDVLLQDNKYSEALEKQKALLPLHQAMFYETNPIPVKYALSTINKIHDVYRLPLLRLEERKRQLIDEILDQSGIV